MFTLASHGDCVIVGRGAAIVLPKTSTLRVRIVAPREDRIETVRREHAISTTEAAERVDTSDRERNRFVADHFRVDPSDPANYDLVLNVARFAPEECADMIIAALRQLRAKAVARPARSLEPVVI